MDNNTSKHQLIDWQSEAVKDYWESFILPARPYDITTEPICYPRLYDYKRPLAEHATKGWHPILRRVNTYHKYEQWVRLPRLTQRYIDAKIRRGQQWLLTSYDDNAFVDFVIFDFDRHHNASMSPEDIIELNEEFWTNVYNFTKAVPAESFLWYQSPGDIFDDERVCGLYAVIKIIPDTVGSLRPFLRAFKARHWLDGVEDCFDIPIKSTRLGGQNNLDIVTVDPETRTIQIIQPSVVELKAKYPHRKARIIENVAHFHLFADLWSRLKPADKLFNDIILSEPISKAAPTEIYTPATVAHISSRATTAEGSWTVQQCLNEKNTFLATTKSKICRNAAITNGGEVSDGILAELEQQFISIRPSDSHTASNPTKRHKDVSRWYRFYCNAVKAEQICSPMISQFLDQGVQACILEAKNQFKARYGYCPGRIIEQKVHYFFSTYNPAKKQKRNVERDKRRAASFKHCRAIDIEGIRIASRYKGMSHKQTEKLIQFYQYANAHDGSVSAKILYAGDEKKRYAVLFDKQEWISLRDTLLRLKMLDRAEMPCTGQCTQWILTPQFALECKAATAEERRIKKATLKILETLPPPTNVYEYDGEEGVILTNADLVNVNKGGIMSRIQAICDDFSQIVMGDSLAMAH